jgi:prophage tail gpP-like protein
MVASSELNFYPPDESVELWVSRVDDPTTYDKLDRWNSYTITSGIMEPAHTFTCDFAGDKEQRDQIAQHGGQRVIVLAHGALQMRGIVDERSDATSSDGTDNQVSGRSVAGLLVDSSLPSNQLNLKGLTLKDLIKRWVSPWVPDYIPNVYLNNAFSRYVMAGGGSTGKGGMGKLQKFPIGQALAAVSATGVAAVPLATNSNYYILSKPKTGRSKYKRFGKNSPYYAGTETEALRTTRMQPGTKAWDAIMLMAEQVGAHAWQAVDGSIVISRPTYDFDADAYGQNLEVFWDKNSDKATGGNIEEVKLDTSIAERFSEYRIISSVKANKGSSGSSLFTTKTIKDPGPPFWDDSLSTNRLLKPGTINAKRLSSPKLVSRIARRTMAEAVVKSFSYSIMVAGHHAQSGALWVPDSLVRVKDERNNINGPMYITRVERRFNRDSGRTTLLELIPPEIWLGKFDSDTVPSATFDAEMRKRVFW